ncbi:hypothetical protein [Sphaerospermopsis sp. LEGE 08334]|uniref:hypothetical protein n=1 Tax=Sphaerospermopsis sp. LEGE 08334 TaxID=1828651 RepID=UPI001882A507|nr:hypothetical protein [Sphaerospermopsis sp. LEGE 08334]MBE9059160.1 hypothetical protein [Sphaerospermopsis sp. LEGE 08334]
MSSSSSRPYQSKVFNFFNQQSRRLSQKLESTIRNLQVATKWSVEALLYPLYQALQPDKLIGKRLQTPGQTTQTYLQSHTPPPADAPIQNVLELVKSLPSAAASESETLQNVKSSGFLGRTWEKITHSFGWLQSPKAPKLPSENTLQHHIPTVQGIAVKLETRNLVLVSDNNKVFDVLTIAQQRNLHETINQEIAEYSQVLQLVAAQKEQNLLPEIDRLLNKLTNSSDSSITENTENRNPLEIKSYPGKILALLDTALAKLEAKAIVPVKQQSQGIIKVAKTQLDIFIYGKDQVEARGEISVNANTLNQRNLNIPALIESAINYFFGGRKIPQLREDEKDYKNYNFNEIPNQPVNTFVDSRQIPTSDLTGNSWLTWGDLFGNLEITSNTTEDKNQQVLNTETRKVFKNKKSASSTTESSFANETAAEKQQQKQHRLKPDWIETTATFIGYEKHPLEQILAWLDYIMLWIEMIFMNMIYFFKGLLQVK